MVHACHRILFGFKKEGNSTKRYNMINSEDIIQRQPRNKCFVIPSMWEWKMAKFVKIESRKVIKSRKVIAKVQLGQGMGRCFSFAKWKRSRCRLPENAFISIKPYAETWSASIYVASNLEIFSWLRFPHCCFCVCLFVFPFYRRRERCPEFSFSKPI